MPPGRRHLLLLATVLACALAVAYCNSFGIAFEFDDYFVVVENAAIRSLRNIPSYFVDPFTATAVRENADLRPVLLATFALNYAISGLTPWSYRLLSLCIHLATCLLVYLILRDHLYPDEKERGANGRARHFAFAAALLLALSPLSTQPVDTASGRSALLCTALYLGSFLAYLRRQTALMTVLFACALLTKAIAITLPAMLLAHAYFYRDRTAFPTLASWVLPTLRRLFVPVVLLGSLCVAYLVYREHLLPPWFAEVRKQPFVTSRIWFQTEWSAYLYYVRLFLLPNDLSIDHDYRYSFTLADPRALASLWTIIAWLVAAFALARRAPLFGFSTLWFFVTLAPESTLLPLAEPVNDHRPYIAMSLGLVPLLVLGIEALVLRMRVGYARGLLGAASLLALAYVPAVLYRNWQWQDGFRIWQSAIDRGPGNGRAWMNAALALLEKGDLVGARHYLEEAKKRVPDYYLVYVNLSIIERLEHHPTEAVPLAEHAVRLNARTSVSHRYLGLALEAAGRSVEAERAYAEAVRIDPRDGAAVEGLERVKGLVEDATVMNEGLLLLGRDPGAAATRFQRVLAHSPTHYGATYQLAAALDAAGRGDEATPLWRKMLAMAEGQSDTPVIARARARLSAPAAAAPGPAPTLAPATVPPAEHR